MVRAVEELLVGFVEVVAAFAGNVKFDEGGPSDLQIPDSYPMVHIQPRISMSSYCG